MSATVNLLIVEDEPADFRLIVRHLEKSGLPARCHCVGNLDELQAALEQGGWDAVLSDFSVPTLDFRHTLDLMTGRHPDLPLIMVSGSVGEEQAVELLKLGVWDFVLKDSLARLVPSIERGLQSAADRRERRRADASVRESEEQFRAMFELASIGMAQADPRTGRWLRVNQKMCEITGYSADQLLGSRVAEITHPEDRQRDGEAFERVVRGEAPDYRMEKRYLRRDGTTAWVNVNMTVIRDAAGQALRTMATIEDITERKRAEADMAALESELRQAQKMDSVGRLAGGVAHDFNNLLAVILGNAELALAQVSSAHPLHADLTEIHGAATRSAGLTRQLLGFARKQIIAPRVLDLNDTVSNMLTMLRRLVGENIQLSWQPGAALWPVNMDPSQIDQVLVNLCVNACDAIGDVGHVTVETGNCTLDADFCAARVGCVPGQRVRLAVRDDGCGMDKETRAHLFEPFFTTKAAGKGTGLGLATVYGIVKQNDGYITVDSEPNQGATFTVYLPRYVGNAEQARTGDVARPVSQGHATILLVEDEPSVLAVTRRMLERQGYTVLAASSPGEAMRLAAAHRGAIDLLLTDVIMPEMSGRDLVAHLVSVSPDLKHCFMSGHPADVIAHHGLLDVGVDIIQKPFTDSALGAKVREVLYRRRDAE
jgi:two-component system cell cycle sensor histidine kinase/response regulator CckA